MIPEIEIVLRSNYCAQLEKNLIYQELVSIRTDDHQRSSNYKLEPLGHRLDIWATLCYELITAARVLCCVMYDSCLGKFWPERKVEVELHIAKNFQKFPNEMKAFVSYIIKGIKIKICQRV